ncbi:MAG: NAAT family transporter [Burkholderiaceae bacterium]|jgi:multiple antibiotic resistance protein|nr:NAAT family transporter [Burkholderiaceae bacterium]
MDVYALFAAFGKSLLFALAAVLPILNPPATVPLFIDLTGDLDSGMRRSLARHIGLNVALMLMGVILIGTYVLAFFGISLPIVRVAGGLIVAYNAWRLLSAQPAERPDSSQQSVVNAMSQQDLQLKAFYPMTFPLTCGPGSISAAIAVGASLHSSRQHWGVTAANFSGGIAAMLIVGVLVWLTFRYADYLLYLLGKVGTVVFLRLAAFILLCVGVQIIWNGASVLLLDLLRAA